MSEYDPNRRERLEIELEEYQDAVENAKFENKQQNKSHLRELKLLNFEIEELQIKLRELT